MSALRLVTPTPHKTAKTNARETIEKRTEVAPKVRKKPKKQLANKTTSLARQSMVDHRQRLEMEIISSSLNTSRRKTKEVASLRERKPQRPLAPSSTGTLAADTTSKTKNPRD
ncbi:MAG: hypothetical protein GY841_04895 [FCB group bacterium]|nr:hypothetical protein [FCB group bacterium]